MKPPPDELGNDPREVGSDSARQSGDAQRLSTTADANGESVEELAETDQAFEAAAVGGIEDAADHPERPVRTHQEYSHPDDLPPARVSDRKKHRAAAGFRNAGLLVRFHLIVRFH
jgi:hypothetical protein